MVGVSAGVRIYQLERYITPLQHLKVPTIIELTSEQWVLELYRPVIESLQSIAWMLLVFFVFALIAYVIVIIAEARQALGKTREDSPNRDEWLRYQTPIFVFHQCQPKLCDRANFSRTERSTP